MKATPEIKMATKPIVVSSTPSPATVRPQTIECIAPTELPGGYQLTVDLNGRAYIVLVPQGGVKEGEQFLAWVLKEDDGNGVNQNGRNHSIPSGRWRDGLCNCCTHGCCHPTCCLAFWCGPLALGQVMTRMGLDWTGTPLVDRRQVRRSAFKILLIAFFVYIAVDQLLSAFTVSYTDMKYEDGKLQMGDLDDASTSVKAFYGLKELVQFIFYIFILVLTIRTRFYIRQRYSIPEQYCCTGCDDCCCSFWCGFCTLTQMARHTADYHTYPADCCSETGLPPYAPMVV